jgi:hypothetical protein
VLNDRLRQQHLGGRVYISRGVVALGQKGLQTAIREIAAQEHFNANNDPHGEHDFGSVVVGGRRLFWKIEAFDRTLTAGAEDPADPATCVRVMTIMLAEEY